MSESGKSILIVDDASYIRQWVFAMLEGIEGAIPLGAGSYAEALAILHTHAVSLALLDINLPDRSGIELLTNIRKHYPGVPVIMMSNQSDELYRSHCKALGASCYIDKSAEFDLLLPTIQNLL